MIYTRSGFLLTVNDQGIIRVRFAELSLGLIVLSYVPVGAIDSHSPSFRPRAGPMVYVFVGLMSNVNRAEEPIRT